jgi:hypothetical protein
MSALGTLDFFNAKTVRRALHLMAEGKVTTDPRFKEGYGLIANMRCGDFQRAIEIIKQQGETCERLKVIGDRHKAKGDEPIGSIIKRAAKTGDKEALDVLASGILDQVLV